MSGTKIRATIYLPEDLFEQLRMEAYKTKDSHSGIIQKALEQYFTLKNRAASKKPAK